MFFRLAISSVFFVLFAECAEQNCTVGDRTYKNGTYFRHQIHFNATCNNGQIKVVNCLTQRGTTIPLGTLLFFEDGFNYTCKDSAKAGNAPKVLDNAEEKLAEECEAGDSHFTREGFVISCDSFALLGCADAYGDLVREGLFVTQTGALRFCFIYQNKRRARIERRGCFNGTRNDDPNDTKYHMRVGQIYETKDFNFRCGDEGLQIYKCKISPKEIIHTGVAWFDRHNVLNICQMN
ncbi:hypothetical protein M3Y97_00070100 [Aphelenchoides bicaudatus]|nr:hypothetical protein M3Y97_00070100 [Aphelenchoides bicaudatus]